MIADEREVAAATEAILSCNSDPGPKLTHYMARRRAQKVIAALEVNELREALAAVVAEMRLATAHSRNSSIPSHRLRVWADRLCVTSDKPATNSELSKAGIEAAAKAGRFARPRGGVSVYLWRDVLSWRPGFGSGHTRWTGIIRFGVIATLRRRP